MKTLTCVECGTVVTRKKLRKTTRFCSWRCAAIARHRELAKHRDTVCPVCGKTFRIPLSLATGAPRYCSRACWRNRPTIHTRTFACEFCGKEVVRWAKQGRSVNAKFCSVQCRARAKAKAIGGYITNQGYRQIGVDGRQILEHRYVMEKIIGRELLPTESVHHRDGDRANNDPPNLELWDKSQPFGQRVSEKIEWAIAFLTRHGYHVSAPHSDALSAFVKTVESRGPLP